MAIAIDLEGTLTTWPCSQTMSLSSHFGTLTTIGMDFGHVFSTRYESPPVELSAGTSCLVG